MTKEEVKRSSLTPACREALEGILPSDDTWAEAEPSLKDKVLD